jgi:hypothetical protein
LAREKAESWRKSDDEWTGRTGWHLIGQLAMKDSQLLNSYFEECLETIEKEIHSRKNRVRDAMNNALIAIGIRNSELETLALAAPRGSAKWKWTTGRPAVRPRTPPNTFARSWPVEARKALKAPEFSSPVRLGRQNLPGISGAISRACSVVVELAP